MARTASARGGREAKGIATKANKPERNNALRERRTLCCLTFVNTAAANGSCASRGSVCLNRLILRDGEAVVSKDGAAPVDLRALMVRDAPQGAPHHEEEESTHGYGSERDSSSVSS